MTGLTSTVNGIGGLYGYRGLSLTSITATRTGSWTWLAAMPAPLASRMVSIRSSMSRCISADASSSAVISRARWREHRMPDGCDLADRHGPMMPADAGSVGRMTNRLADQSSPYLRQHADNPVDWYPWGDEAFARAKAEDKPILLSVGYSACHWCHVMAHESFEDDDTAEVMNRLFVNVKVDREERPDVDSIYMTAVQSLTGRAAGP